MAGPPLRAVSSTPNQNARAGKQRGETPANSPKLALVPLPPPARRWCAGPETRPAHPKAGPEAPRPLHCASRQEPPQ
eukprot:2035483-Alexandrium_andersonii.AAC.1